MLRSLISNPAKTTSHTCMAFIPFLSPPAFPFFPPTPEMFRGRNNPALALVDWITAWRRCNRHAVQLSECIDIALNNTQLV